MYKLQRLSGWVCVFLTVNSLPSYAALKNTHEQSIRSGFALAQACESEIDDDMAMYEECIGHAVNRAAKQKHVLLGVHFQAWLMADLATRQNSPRALALRKRHQQGIERQLRTTGHKLDQLCDIKQLVCASVRTRMGQQLQ